MINNIKKVEDFHNTFNQPVLNTPTIPSEDRCILRQKLLQEEVDELNEAWINKDIVGIADAITDILYIVFGTTLEFGLKDKIQECFDEVHSSNMSKLDINGKPIYNEYGKVIKSELYFKPNLKDILEK